MNDPVVIVLISAGAGLISGTVASLFAPWIHWGIEKRRNKLDERKNLIKNARELVININNEQERINELLVTNPNEIPKELKYPKAITYLDALQRYQQFHAIKPFLSKPTIELLSDSNLYNLEGRGSKLGQLPEPFRLVLNDISKLEREWELI